MCPRDRVAPRRAKSFATVAREYRGCCRCQRRKRRTSGRRWSDCCWTAGWLVLGDVNNRADDNLVYQNLQGILVFGFKRSSGIKVVGNTLRDNISSAIEVQRGAANAELRDNILSGNGTGIVDSGTATIRSDNGPQ